MKLVLKNDLGIVKYVDVGWNWPMLFLGPIIPLIKGDVKWFIIMISISGLVGLNIFGFMASTFLEGGVIGILLGSGVIIMVGTPFAGLLFFTKYNKLYAKFLYEKGYKPSSTLQSEMFFDYINS